MDHVKLSRRSKAQVSSKSTQGIQPLRLVFSIFVLHIGLGCHLQEIAQTIDYHLIGQLDLSWDSVEGILRRTWQCKLDSNNQYFRNCRS